MDKNHLNVILQIVKVILQLLIIYKIIRKNIKEKDHIYVDIVIRNL
jgi:hypothetical protein